MGRGRRWTRRVGSTEVMLLAFAIATASGIPWELARWLA